MQPGPTDVLEFALDLRGRATDISHVGQVPISRMTVAHPVTPNGSPCEPLLTVVCGLRHVYFVFADHTAVASQFIAVVTPDTEHIYHSEVRSQEET